MGKVVKILSGSNLIVTYAHYDAFILRFLILNYISYREDTENS